MRRTIASVAVCVTTIGGIAMASPVHASAPSSWGTAQVAIPTSIDGVTTTSVPFTVTSPEGVCEVRAFPHEVSKHGEGQYTLTLDLDRLDPGSNETTVVVEACSGAHSYQEVMILAPLTAQVTAQLTPWAEYPKDEIEVTTRTEDGSPAAIEFLHNGEVVKRQDAVTEASYRVGKKDAEGTWQVRVSDAAGRSLVRDVDIARKWAPMKQDGTGVFPACSTVQYFYDKTLEPKRARGMAKDIKKALGMFEKATGLQFVPAPDKESADLRIDWQHLWGPAGLGGYSYSGDEVLAEVTFDTSTHWVGWKGFGRTRNIPNRGALILHEIGHALGLDHVTNDDAVMSTGTEAGDPTHLTKYDKAGLAALYQPASCADGAPAPAQA